MNKAYTITPEEYCGKSSEIRRIEYSYGDDAIYAPARIRSHYKNLKKICADFEEPADSMFMRNADLYNLWLNQDTTEPITARELFNIINGIREELGHMIFKRSPSTWL